jgi:WXG100 family type VII secretion target
MPGMNPKRHQEEETMDKVQMKYEELEQIAARIAEWSSRTGDTLQKLNQQYQILEGGGWIGRGFDKFADELTGPVFTAMGKLAEVLDNLSNVVRQASDKMQEAEQDAASRFRA